MNAGGVFDAEAQLKVFVAHRGALVDYAAPILGSRAQAEDVVQEAYLRFAAPSSPGTVHQPLSYLYRIVRNLALDVLRRRSAEDRRDAAFAETLEDRTAPSPEDKLIHRRELDRVAEALAELPDVKRAAFEMSRLGGLTFHEIAKLLQISPASAHRYAQDALVHIMRGLK